MVSGNPTEGHPMPLKPKPSFGRMAVVFSAVPLLSTLVLIVWYVAGPKSGMEALAILFPWMICVTIHVVMTFPAVVCAWKSKTFILSTLIIVY